MRLFNHHFLRIFVVLLITVFSTNTVYAGSMMVSADFNNITEHAPAQSSVQARAVLEPAVEHHCHDHDSPHQIDSDQHHNFSDALLSHQSQHQSSTHGGCGHCNHCLACYSMMFYDQVSMASISGRPVLAIAANVLYLAPDNSRPNKPPIS